MIKIIIFSLIVFLTTAQTFAESLQNQIAPNTKSAIVSDSSEKAPLDSIFTFAKDTIFWILWVIAIWAFLFIWIRLVIARWNPEEFKKATQQLIYAVVWLFVVAIAWAAVRLVAWLNIG